MIIKYKCILVKRINSASLPVLSKKRSINMLTLSNLAALLASFVLAVNASPGAQPSPDVGTIFAVYPGWDMDNGSILTTLGCTELACMQSCSASEFLRPLIQTFCD